MDEFEDYEFYENFEEQEIIRRQVYDKFLQKQVFWVFSTKWL